MVRRLALASLLAALFVVGAQPAAEAVDATPTTGTTTTTTTAPTPTGPDHTILFPVVGKVTWTDTFGAPRSGGRTHEGQDLMGQKMQQLIATDDGTITYITDGTLAGNMVQLTATDGWVYSYLHLNNDTPGTDDGAAPPELTFGPGIVKGAKVTAGQLIGYLGDSGNAESTGPHLHFELKTPGGITINAAPTLTAARHVDQEVPTSTAPVPAIPRLAGADRVATAIAVSKEGWPAGAADAVVAAGDRYEEALPASVLAAARQAPLLLTVGTTPSAALVAELQRLGASRVTVIGSVPTTVDAGLAAPNRTVTRLGRPDDAVSTAVAVAQAVGGAGGTAVLVNQQRFADGVSATAVAAGRGWPVLLTGTDVVPQASVDAWRALGVRRIVVVGGTSVVAQKIADFAQTSGRCAGGTGCEVERLAGADRYATSVAVAQRSVALGGRSTKEVLLGTGTAYPDVLASGPLAARVGGISLLVDGSGAGADAASRAFLTAQRAAVGEVTILGGTGAVTTTAVRVLGAALGLH